MIYKKKLAIVVIILYIVLIVFVTFWKGFEMDKSKLELANKLNNLIIQLENVLFLTNGKYTLELVFGAGGGDFYRYNADEILKNKIVEYLNIEFEKVTNEFNNL